jgi:signal transduction histidine kinase
MAPDIDDNKGSVQSVSQDSHGGNLLSLASHELRTPLSIIKWYTEMLLDGDAGALNDDQTKYLRTIQTSNQRAIDLIRSLLNVSRLDLGTFSINPTDVDLRFLVKQILTENKTLLEEKRMHTEEKYDSAIPGIIPIISVDKQICLVILRSLIANAILFSKEESIVSVHVCEMKQGEDIGSKKITENSLVISVSDSGIGIPESDQENIFSRFFKAGNAINEDFKGAGLGLYIVQTILDKVGGEIWFNSKQNVGSTFYVSFPMSGMTKKEGRTTLV